VSSLTTLGTTLAATCSTLPAGTLAAGTLGATPAMVGPAAVWSGCISTATPPPMPADTTAIASAPAVSTPARDRLRGGSDGWGAPRYGSYGARNCCAGCRCCCVAYRQS